MLFELLRSILLKNYTQTHVITPIPSRSYDNNECAICLEPQINKSRPYCGHVFCYDCLVNWSLIKMECPTCKQPFKYFAHDIQSPTDYLVCIPEAPSVRSQQSNPSPYVYSIINPPQALLNSVSQSPAARASFLAWLDTHVIDDTA